jgi:amidophosphoribosyltransferase
MSTIRELVAPRLLGAPKSPDLSPEDLQKLSDHLGTDSLKYLTLDALTSAIGASKDELCLGCLTGEYPTPWGNALFKEALRTKDQPQNGRTYEHAVMPTS